MKKLILALSLIISLLTLLGCGDKTVIEVRAVTIQRVIDGDTLVTNEGEKIRLVGLNTPENTKTKEQYGVEATEYVKNLLTGKTVYLESDVEEKDQYDRTLGYIWLQKPKSISDEELLANQLNSKLIREGYGVQYTFKPNVKYKDYYTRFEEKARSEKAGLWAIDEDGTTRGDYQNAKKYKTAS